MTIQDGGFLMATQHWVVSSQGSNTQWYTILNSMSDNPRWWISHGNTEWYQVKAAIHNVQYFESHGWQSKMVDFPWQHWVELCQGSNTRWYTILSSMGDKPRWWISQNVTLCVNTNSLINLDYLVDRHTIDLSTESLHFEPWSGTWHPHNSVYTGVDNVRGVGII